MAPSLALVAVVLALACSRSDAHFGRLMTEGQPAPASIGADVPLTYFGPPPSSVLKELVGPLQLLTSGTIDTNNGTITLPIYKGIVDGPDHENPSKGQSSFFYVVTDTNDAGNAAALGINYSGKLTYARVGRGARTAYLHPDQLVHFRHGHVDFTPVRKVVPGSKAPFPPASAQPGSVGDDFYSPLFVLTNGGGKIYNAPIIADGSNAALSHLRKWCDDIPDSDLRLARTLIHDKISKICINADGTGGTATLDLTDGFSFSKPVLYLSTDSNDPGVAAIESATYAPGLKDVKVGGDDSLFSAVERIFITINGYTNQDINNAHRADGPGESVHPSRQGLNSALLGEGDPLNVLGGIPTVATDYSPLWDANVLEWTPYSVANGYRVRMLEEFQVLGLAEKGFITGPGGAPFGSTGIIINCPIAFRFL